MSTAIGNVPLLACVAHVVSQRRVAAERLRLRSSCAGFIRTVLYSKVASLAAMVVP